MMGVDRIECRGPVFVCRPEGGYVAGTCGNRVAAVWTKRTLWVGCQTGREAFLSAPARTLAGELWPAGKRPASVTAHDGLRHVVARLVPS